jgi:hypothetical protein
MGQGWPEAQTVREDPGLTEERRYSALEHRETAMGKINLENLKPGMILASSVTERGGRVLLGAGVELTEKHISIFRKWGVTEADVQNITQEEATASVTSQLDPLVLREAENRMTKLFQLTDRNQPFVQELYRLCTVRWIRQKSRGRLV